MRLGSTNMPDSATLHGGEGLRVLYVSYSSLEDPLLWTQVVAYLAGLAQRGHSMHLLTFEPRLDSGKHETVARDLKNLGITWHSRRYHKRPSLLATVFDALHGAFVSIRLTRRHRFDVIHVRNHVPAAMALIACRFINCRMIFDLRGLMADEYADAGRWKRGGVPYRLTERVQRATLRQAYAVTIRTQAVRPYLGLPGFGEDAPVVIPACADVERIQRWSGECEAVRAEIGAGDRPIMVYVGKFTGWYMEHEMADFVAVAKRLEPELFFLIVTQADPTPMLEELNRCGIGPLDYRILESAPNHIGRYLAAADVAISFIRPCLSKISSSPTKIGEYLAAGLPVVSSSGIGDVDALLHDNRTGVLVTDFCEPSYKVAAECMRALLADPHVRDRCRNVAERELSLSGVGIPQYHRLYRRLVVELRAHA